MSLALPSTFNAKVQALIEVIVLLRDFQGMAQFMPQKASTDLSKASKVRAERSGSAAKERRHRGYRSL